MKLLFVADGRSPIAQNWIRHWIEAGHEVTLATTFACEPITGLNGMELTPAAFSGVKSVPTGEIRPKGFLWGARTLGLRATIRHWFGPLTLPRSARRLAALINQARPDLIHALRIPYEGMLAAQALSSSSSSIPLLVSVWGNDFTLHASSTPLMAYYTRRTLRRTSALHADCQRDIRLASEWGFIASRPTLVTPGNGGILTELFYQPTQPVSTPVIINPRGFRAYVRNDTFFKSIPLVLQKHPQARFICASMAGEPKAIEFVNSLHIQSAVDLLAPRSHVEMAEIFRSSSILVSPSFHDGTPNTLLEGMACGCFPIAGDLDSIREWITPGENGLLIDPSNPQALADAICLAIEQPDLRFHAAIRNATIIAERAEYNHNMAQAEAFYRKITKVPVP
jgi:glycosyltransferase involved in cell wall biosynthesis